MKASVTFRDDAPPLARAKVPITILGLPFLSAASASAAAADLRLDLATAFPSGPSLRLSYRPNLPSGPFSLLLKTGLGALGSPANAPFSMSAEFSIPTAPNSTPSFSILFKPTMGDFHLKRTIKSTTDPRNKIKGDSKTNGSEAPVIDFQSLYGNHSDSKDKTDTGSINALLSGVNITASSVLPLWSRAAMRFRWGVKVPQEIASVSPHKLPLLVMSKISIAHVPADEAKGKAKINTSKDSEVTELCMAVSRQLEGMKVENEMLRKVVEELRRDVCGKAVSGAAPRVGDVGGVKAVAAGRRGDVNVKQPEFVGKPRQEEVDEELKKALRGAIGAGK